MKLSYIKFVVLDVDGTLTDGGIYITESGEELKKFNVKDGMGIRLLLKAGVQVGIISHSRSSGMVEQRAQTLGIAYCYVGKSEKLGVLQQWVDELGISLEEVCYVGDDINDIAVMEAVGIGACPADAVKLVREKADIVLGNNGGQACIRELVDVYFELYGNS